MKWHIAVQVGDVPPDVTVGEGEQVLPLAVDTQGAPGSLSHNVWDKLGRSRLPESPPAAVDLFRMAAAVFAADLRIPRAGPRSDSWTRDLMLHLPVTDVDLWNAARQDAEAFLRFLTGDVWHIEFSQADFGMPPPRRLRDTEAPLDASVVCLLSGGLDSFIGASDTLARGERPYLVSVGSQGSAAHSTRAQDRTASALRERYGADHLRYLRFRASPPRKQYRGQQEDTQRSRSVLFMGLGVLTAATVGPDVPLIIPENGFITLNVPLTPSRLGTLSTRTTHPETIRLFEALLRKVGIGNPLLLPYRFATKGEMLDNAADRDWVIDTASDTVSCAHPTGDRFLGGKILRHHCGHCLPCIIRRASLHHVDADDLREYRRNILTEGLDPGKRGADVRAARIAALRDPDAVGVADVLRSGPLPADETDLHRYVGVYRSGLRELAQFFNPG
ncbi:MAG TPA: Qat anti-phage system QueC-like protein QatC [Longimicrobium sp.]|jgi:hypothetical protein